MDSTGGEFSVGNSTGGSEVSSDTSGKARDSRTGESVGSSQTDVGSPHRACLVCMLCKLFILASCVNKYSV